MYTSVHSDASQESGFTLKERATFIRASQALMWMRALCCFYSSSERNQLWE